MGLLSDTTIKTSYVGLSVKNIHVPVTHLGIRITFLIHYVHMRREQETLNKSSSNWKLWMIIKKQKTNKQKNLSVWPEDNAGALIAWAGLAAWVLGCSESTVPMKGVTAM